MRRLMPILMVTLLLALLVAACGGDDTDAGGPNGDSGTTQATTDQGSTGSDTNGGAGESPEPIGPVAMDTIQIGDTTWSRTLPMTTGQCFLQQDDSLGTSAVAWGTLDGDDDLRFSADYDQDGTFGSEVSNGQDVYWIAGERSPGVDDLTIELDFDGLTIVGEGTYTSLITGESAAGSFAFQCEPDEG